MEAYHINRQAVVALWFRMSKPEVRGFAARTGLILSVLDPHGVALQVSQPMSERSEIWVQNRTVAIMNGDAFDVDLTDLYMLSALSEWREVDCAAHQHFSSKLSARLPGPPTLSSVT